MSVLFNTYSRFLINQMKKNDEINFKDLKFIDGVSAINNISYLNDNNKYHLFNMYYPSEVIDKRKLPLMIDIHGGGWIYGDKDLNRFHNAYYSSQGMVTLSMSYRLIPKVKFIDMVKDLFSFFHYIEKEKDNLNIDFKNVLLSGDSAGGHLALLIHAINNSEELQKIFGVTHFNIEFKMLNLEHPVPYLNLLFIKENETKSFANSCMMKAFFGSKFRKNPLYLNSSLDNFVSKVKFPKTIIVTSSLDSFRPYTLKAYEDLKVNNVDVTLKDYENEVHVFEVSRYDKEKSREYNDFVIKEFFKLIKGDNL